MSYLKYFKKDTFLRKMHEIDHAALTQNLTQNPTSTILAPCHHLLVWMKLLMWCKFMQRGKHSCKW